MAHIIYGCYVIISVENKFSWMCTTEKILLSDFKLTGHRLLQSFRYLNWEYS